jgi:hypothetical protein
VGGRDWVAWHTAYDDPVTRLSARLSTVQDRIREVLDAAAPGPVRVVSACAGDGRDLLGVLTGHPRARDVRARLVEREPRLVARARTAAAGVLAAGGRVEVTEGDAGHTDSYLGAVPADLVLVCGVFGNVSDADIARTVDALPGFVAPGATVIWTRHREDPDLVPDIDTWFARAGFERRWLSARDAGYGVGVHRFTGTPRPLRPGERLFTFRAEAG